MTFPTIPTGARVLSNVQANTTATRTGPAMSGLTKNSGDLLIFICIGYQTSTGTNAAFSGWTQGFTEFHDSATSTTMAIGAAYKWSDGTETAAPAVTQAGTITGHAAMFLLSIPGAHASTPPEAGGRASGTTGVANPAAFNPSGWDVEDTLWINVGASGETSGTGSYTGIATTNPTNYSNIAETGISADAVGGVEGAVAFRQLAAASEDAAGFTKDTSNARDAAIIIAVRPAAIPIPITSRYQVGATAPSATRVTSSFTPAANSKLYVHGYCQASGTTPTLAISDSLGSTWTEKHFSTLGNVGFRTTHYLWELDIGASPSARTVTLTVSGPATADIGISVFDAVDGYVIKTSQIAGTVQQAPSTVTTGTLPAAATADNYTILVEGANRDSFTALSIPSGFTLIAGTSGGSQYEQMAVSYSTTFTGTSTTHSNSPDNLDAATVLFELWVPPPAINLTPTAIASGEAFPTPSAGDPRVAMVVDDIAGPAPSANDIIMRDILVADGMTVTYLSETAAPPSDTSTYDVVVHTESGSSSGTAITAYPTMAVPLVFLETSWQSINMSTAAATNPTSTTQYDIIETGHDIVAGLADPFTWRTGASGNYGVTTAEKASGAVQVCAPVGNTGHCTVLGAESGAALTSGNAPARRVCSGVGVGSAPASWTADAGTLLIQMVRWAANVTGSGGHTVSFPVTQTDTAPTAIGSSEAHGTQVLTLGGTMLQPGGIASGEAFPGGAQSNPNLPVTLDDGTGAVESESHSYSPVIMDSNGTLYRIQESQLSEAAGFQNQPRAMKSTDGGETWAEMDANNRPGRDTGSIGDLESGWTTWHEETKIITFTWQRSYVVWSGFRTSDHPTNPDTWVSNTREQIASVTGSPQYASHTSPPSEAYEWIFFNNGSTNPQYRSRTGPGSYGTITALDSSGQHPAAILDSADVSHILYRKGTNELHYKKLTASGTLDGASTRVDTNNTHTVPIAHAAPQAWISGADTYVGCLFLNGSGHLKFVLITNGTAGAEETITTQVVTSDPGATGNQGAVCSLAVDPVTGTMYAIWSESTFDVMYSSRPHGGAWSTPDVLQGPPWLPAYVYCKVLTRPDASRTLGYVYVQEVTDDDSMTKYAEMDITAGGGATVTVLEPSAALTPTAIPSAEAFGTQTVNVITGLSPTGIASLEAFGSPTANVKINLSPTAIASLEAFGTATANVKINLSPTAIASLEAFGTTTVNVKISLAPTGIATAEAFGTTTANVKINLSPTAIASLESFGTASITGLLVVSPTGIATLEAFGSPVMSGLLTVSPSGIASLEAFGNTATGSFLVLSPSAIASLEAFGTAVMSGQVTLSPSAIASLEAFGVAATGGFLTLSPSGIVSLEALGSPVLNSILSISPTGIASAQALGSPTVGLILTTSPTGIASAEVFGSPSITGLLVISPTGIVTAEAFGSPVAGGGLTIVPTGITSGEAFGTLVMNVKINLSPTGIVTAEVFGVTSVNVQTQLSPTGIASAEALGSPVLSSVLTISPTGIITGMAFGSPTMGGVLIVSPSSIISGEAFGVTTVFLPMILGPQAIASLQAFGFPEVTGASGVFFTGWGIQI